MTAAIWETASHARGNHQKNLYPRKSRPPGIEGKSEMDNSAFIKNRSPESWRKLEDPEQ